MELKEEFENMKNSFNRQAKKMSEGMQKKEAEIEERNKKIRELETRILEDHKNERNKKEEDDLLGGGGDSS